MPTRGEAVRYRSISGEVYDAVLTSDLRKDGTIGVDVHIGDCRSALSLSKVTWSDCPTAETFAAWPLGGVDEGKIKA